MKPQIKSGILVASVAALITFSLVAFKKSPNNPTPAGTDDQATTAIMTLAPDYKPWFKSVYTTSTPGADTLLFALQAAIGAGFIGYYVGYARGRAGSVKTTDSKRAH